MIVCLLLLYPSIRVGQLVGTDLVQAVPLVGAASLGHLLYGDFNLGLTGSILVGAIPGVWVGARISSTSAAGSLVRRTLVLIMFASGVKLLGASNVVLTVATGTAVVVGTAVWAWIRTRHGEAPMVWQQRRRPRGSTNEVVPPDPTDRRAATG
jgi:hypothetical protein